jgi:hypothetical protein
LQQSKLASAFYPTRTTCTNKDPAAATVKVSIFGSSPHG